MKTIGFRIAAFLLCGILAMLLLAGCGEDDLDYMETAEAITYYDADDITKPCDDAAIITIAFTSHEPFIGNMLNYEFLWHEGRNREWEEDIVFFAASFLASHELLGKGVVIDNSRHGLPNVYSSRIRAQTLDTRYGQAVGRTVPETMINLSGGELRAEFLEIINDLILRIPELTDFEILMGLYRSIAITNDCHSGITLPQNYLLPIIITSAFPKQHSETSHPFPLPAIRSAYAGIAETINTQIIAINGVDLEEILNRMRLIFPSENEIHLHASHIGHIRSKEFLQYIGVMGDESTIPVTVRNVNGEVFTTDISFVQSLTGVEMVHHVIDTETFFFMSRPNDDYWFRYFSDDDIMYLRIARFTSFEQQAREQFMTLSQRNDLPSMHFAHELIDAIVELSGVGTLIIDVRSNPGGATNFGLEHFLVWGRDNRELLGNVYIAIDHFSFSHSVVFAMLAERFLDDALFIGSPTGGALNLFGGGVPRTMKNSQTRFFVGENYTMLDPYTETNTLYPDIFVYRTLEDFANSHDAVIETIRQRKLN